jgi:hypothetical protein
MTTQHDPVNFIAGDTWEISVTCIDQNDIPFNLNSAVVIWTLVNRNSGQALISPAECTVNVTDALAGKCTIVVPSLATSKVPDGAHQDSLRLTTATGVASMLSVGTIVVMADPFRV